MNGFTRGLFQQAPRQIMPGIPFTHDLFASTSAAGGICSEEQSHQPNDYSNIQLKGNSTCRSSGVDGLHSPAYPIYDLAYAEPFPGTATSMEGWGRSTPLLSPLENGPSSINPCSLSSAENSIGYISPPALSISSGDSWPRTYIDDLNVFRPVPLLGPYYTQPHDNAACCLEGGTPFIDRSNEHAHRNHLRTRFDAPHLLSFHGSPFLGPQSPVISWPRSYRSSPFTPFDEDSALDEFESAESTSDKPYAKLIWEAMMERPDKRMTLREIYEWFSKRTNKVKESGGSGWQNSIRHNLSMNQVFHALLAML